MSSYSILFVCMGNICRSPTAHGVFRQMVTDQGLAQWVNIDSAGTHNYHPGSPADARSQHHALKRGYDLSDLRARQITDSDFETYDLILAMDWDNLALIQAACPDAHQGKVRRLTEFCQRQDSPVVPDPYYCGDQGFEQVLDLVEDACEGLIKHVKGHAK
ncbi:low molecular weight protein-tyrosine-phosphatase [Rhodoferax sp. PAMC 29310]|uniref:low molecular weight protein-tyrosine-phosphatase n=1 Tax=Rhodoferax sp. PAMC 29310 TaxID=2822760 RepID=UPI001B32584E|nr:low molecular weight protein-tyrosine-phosphatase [Rhodoferax sp. PAMC 29310]